MDRRREPRFEIDRPVRVMLLDGADIRLEGRVANVSAGGMRLILERALPLNAPVRIDSEDSILLGEVCYCLPAADHFSVGVILDQALHELSALKRLVDSLTDTGWKVKREAHRGIDPHAAAIESSTPANS